MAQFAAAITGIGYTELSKRSGRSVLSLATEACRNAIADAESQDGLPEYIERVERLKERYRYVHDVPVLETLPASGSIGVAGPKDVAADVVRGLAVQREATLFWLASPPPSPRA